MSGPGFRVALWLPVCAMAFARPSWGQESGSARWRLTGAWLAVGPNAPFLTRLGTRHHDLYVLGLRAERALVQHGALQLYHTVDALPLAVSTAMPVRYDDGTCAGAPPQDQATCPQWVPHFGTVYGLDSLPWAWSCATPRTDGCASSRAQPSARCTSRSGYPTPWPLA